MKTTQTHVTRGPWGFSTTNGSEIDGYQINVYRFPNAPKSYRKMMTGQINGIIVKTREEAGRLGMVYGFLQHYSRNSCRFVMSRAARKRGYITTDRLYGDRVVRHMKEGRSARPTGCV